MRGRMGMIVGGVAGLAIVGLIVWLATREAAHEHEEARQESEEAAEEEAGLEAFGGFEEEGEGGSGAGTGSGADPGPGPRPGGWGDGTMRERMRRRFEIVPLGERPPDVQPEQLAAAMRKQRPALRACLQQAGGWRVLREAMRATMAPDAGRRRPRTTFDLGPDGRIVPGTLAFVPPLPESVHGCMTEVFMQAEWPAPGGDGARVEMPMGAGRGGRGGRSGGDGGVPWRGRKRFSDETPRGE